jgi:lipid A 3-O-deacylase
MRSILQPWVVLVLVCLPAVAQEPRSLAVGFGMFNFNKSETTLEGGVEYRHPTGVWKLAAAGGLYANAEGAVWGFGGLRRDFRLADRWWVTPGFGVALYSTGDSKNLGGPVEFRSSLELARELGSRNRIALVIYHLSNAGLYTLNPGSNSLIVTYSFPLGP